MKPRNIMMGRTYLERKKKPLKWNQDRVGEGSCRMKHVYMHIMLLEIMF